MPKRASYEKWVGIYMAVFAAMCIVVIVAIRAWFI